MKAVEDGRLPSKAEMKRERRLADGKDWKASSQEMGRGAGPRL